MSSRSKGMSGHQHPYNGLSHEWETPPELLKIIGPFDDDPCDGGDYGLARRWKGLVWCNPPYGPYVGQWLRKLAEHRNGIALVFARTETRWFFSEVWEKATAVLFLRGRLHFYKDGKRAISNSGAPSVLISYGKQATLRLRDSNTKLNGKLVILISGE